MKITTLGMELPVTLMMRKMTMQNMLVMMCGAQ
jgi:hypothetical protein